MVCIILLVIRVLTWVITSNFCMWKLLHLSMARSRISYVGENVPISPWRHQIKDFPRYWPFVREIHRSPLDSPHKGQWRGALMFSLIWTNWSNSWANNRDVADLRQHRPHHDVAVVLTFCVRDTITKVPIQLERVRIASMGSVKY